MCKSQTAMRAKEAKRKVERPGKPMITVNKGESRKWRMVDGIPSPGLFLGGNGKLLILDNLVDLHLVQGLIGNGETQFLLRLHEPDPELAPCAHAHARREQVLHLIA